MSLSTVSLTIGIDINRLPFEFYARPAPIVAQALLGKRLVRITRNGAKLAGYIVEAEAYEGANDPPSHAYRGPTPRNQPMFGPPGHTYVYFIYGVHWMFNIVAHPDAQPGAVLIRALEPAEGIPIMKSYRNGRSGRELTNGPARLTQALGITKALNAVDLCTHPQLYLEPGKTVATGSIASGPRIRVSGDKEAQARPWRFWITGNTYIST
ncbi:MAG: DNA-3-methyladenine glycosylase [Anaerolineae bacterium]|nr:DNA-3-methyladenine glycosylase [Anaerolineae bacterium]